MIQELELDSPAQDLRVIEGRKPPFDLEAEAIVLSELLVNPETSFDRVASIISEDKFWSNANRYIFRGIKHLQDQHQLVDIPTVAGVLKEKGWLDKVGGTPYLTQIGQATPAAGPYLEQHAERVRELWRRRMVIARAQQIVAEGYGDVGDGQEWVEKVENDFSVLAHEYSEHRALPVGEVAGDQLVRLFEAQSRGESISGLETGFAKLDHLISGLHAGDLYVIAARPGMGKTAMLTSILMNIARPQQVAVMMFSLEQPKEQIGMRILCGEANASFSRVRQNHFHEDDYTKLEKAVLSLKEVPLYIDDKPAITLMEIRAQTRKLQRQIQNGTAPVNAQRLGAIGVDYMQLMKAEREIRIRNSREQEVSSFSQGLKNLAKELGIPVLALSQLNRAVEKRDEKIPNLSDLRESGAIEQDADCIMFLYRKGYYEKTRTDNRCDVIVAKQRNGPTDTIQVAFEPETTQFRSLTDAEDIQSYDFDDSENQDGFY